MEQFGRELWDVGCWRFGGGGRWCLRENELLYLFFICEYIYIFFFFHLGPSISVVISEIFFKFRFGHRDVYYRDTDRLQVDMICIRREYKRFKLSMYLLNTQSGAWGCLSSLSESRFWSLLPSWALSANWSTSFTYFFYLLFYY